MIAQLFYQEGWGLLTVGVLIPPVFEEGVVLVSCIKFLKMLLEPVPYGSGTFTYVQVLPSNILAIFALDEVDCSPGLADSWLLCAGPAAPSSTWIPLPWGQD